MKRAIFLDRDGILNHVVLRDATVASPRTLEEFAIQDHAADLVKTIKTSGFLAIVVTNQPDIGRGLMDAAILGKMHELLRAAMPLDAIQVAESGDDADPRRKPNPGMLLEAADRWNVNLEHSWLIGDSKKDIEAGVRAGVGTILLETSYNTTIHGSAHHNLRSLTQITHLIPSL